MKINKIKVCLFIYFTQKTEENNQVIFAKEAQKLLISVHGGLFCFLNCQNINAIIKIAIIIPNIFP